jgi:hypothetical protein
MEKLISNKRYLTDPVARTLFESIDARAKELLLAEAIFYYDFPSFRDYEDDTCRANALLLSPNHGIVALNFCDSDTQGRPSRNRANPGPNDPIPLGLMKWFLQHIDEASLFHRKRRGTGIWG